MQVPYVGWEVTNRCNLDCEFCYSFMFEQSKAPTTRELQTGISRLRSLGLLALNFCGGEPLLRTDLPDLFTYTKSLGIETILSTNGDLLERQIGHFGNCLDWIALPLDGGVLEHHDHFRGPGSFDRFPHKLLLVRDQLPSVGIKINTVVTATNITSVHLIPDVLRAVGLKVRWKIIQFSPRGRARQRQEHLAVSDEDFHSLSAKVSNQNLDFDIDVSPNQDRDRGCLILNQHGDMQVPIGDSYVFLGNIFEIDIDEFLLRPECDSCFSPARNNSLHNRSYRGESSGVRLRQL